MKGLGSRIKNVNFILKTVPCVCWGGEDGQHLGDLRKGAIRLDLAFVWRMD